MHKEEVIEFMKSTDLKSLKCLAAVKVAMTVCQSEDVQNMIGRFKLTDGNGRVVGYSDGQWRQLCGKVRRKLGEIGAPDLIIDIVLDNLWPISFEISKWIIFHVEETGINCSSSFFWTSQESLDYVKIAEFLVKNEVMDISKRYKLACIYCLESDVRYLWDQMDLLEKRSFFVRGNLNKSNKNLVVLYWTYYIQEVSIDYWDSKILKITELFKYSTAKGYLTATKYFVGKLKLNYRNRLYFNYLSNVSDKLSKSENVLKDHLGIACFLACETPWGDTGIKLFESLIVRYFLEWPMQRYFMAVVNRMGARRYHRERILEEVLKKDLAGFKDYNYKELFKEFWHQYPDDYKEIWRHEPNFSCKLILKFVKKHFGFVFVESSLALKKKFRAIVLQQEISEDETFFEKENVDFFKFLVQELLVPASFVDRFSEDNFLRYLYCDYEREFCNLPLGEFKNLLRGILENV